jgi:hypothetical protein
MRQTPSNVLPMTVGATIGRLWSMLSFLATRKEAGSQHRLYIMTWAVMAIWNWQFVRKCNEFDLESLGVRVCTTPWPAVASPVTPHRASAMIPVYLGKVLTCEV